MADYPDLTQTNAQQRARYAAYPSLPNYGPVGPTPSSDDATVSSNNALLRAQQAKYPVTVGKPASPVMDALGTGLQTILGIGNAEGAGLENKSDYSQGAAGPTTPTPPGTSYGFGALGGYADALRRGLTTRGAPSAAESAAFTAAAKSNSAGSNYSNEGRQPVIAPAPPREGYYSNEADSGPALPRPGFDKASGVAAINAGGGPHELNYGEGPGNTIYGMSVNGSKKLNSFYGPGAGPIPVGASAGASAGGANANDPVAQAYAHVTDLMNQAQALRARGDITGALQARGLESHAKILSTLFGALAQHTVAARHAGVAERQATTQEGIAYPGIEFGAAAVNAARAGDFPAAAGLARVKSGESMQVPSQSVAPLGYQRDPFTGELKWVGFPQMQK